MSDLGLKMKPITEKIRKLLQKHDFQAPLPEKHSEVEEKKEFKEEKIPDVQQNADLLVPPQRTYKRAFMGKFKKLIQGKITGRKAIDIATQFSVYFDRTDLDVPSKIEALLRTALTEILSKFSFKIQLKLDCTMINTDTGAKFPVDVLISRNGMFTVRTQADKEKFIEIVHRCLNAFKQGDEEYRDIYPDTKTILELIRMLTFIIHKQSTGGCVGKNLIRISPKALWNPDNFDDTCGWQCLAVGLYGKEFPAIKKKRGKVNKQRMEKVMYLKNLYHRLTKTKKSESNHIELSEWKAISEAFKLDIRIYMRQSDCAKIVYPKFDLPNVMTGKI